MQRALILCFLLVIPCLSTAKDKSFPIPPLTSHGQPITKCACIFTEQSETSVDEYYYWDVIAYAEYGPEHKRYWSKRLGTFKGTAAITSHTPESVGTGRPIGQTNETVYLGDAEKTCSEWKQAVHQLMKKAGGR